VKGLGKAYHAPYSVFNGTARYTVILAVGCDLVNKGTGND
jgi:hypothetical protein